MKVRRRIVIASDDVQAESSGSETNNSPKRRQAKNDVTSVGITTNEKVMRAIFELYTNSDQLGFCRIAESLNLKELFPPRKKIKVMICGNHSSGKSSFINWYIGEHIQKTGVAIETQGFTLVTCGKRRETLMGVATLQLFPYLTDISQRLKGVVENLTTEVCCSRERNFPEVTFLDTPGLVDGLLQYHFPVEEAICELAQYCDLILVFFDPIGQALCKRTMDIIENLNEKYGSVMRYYLSKADEVESSEQDRQKVLIQITQNLSGRIKNQNFDLPTIYLPGAHEKKVPNSIGDVCRDIEKTINLNVQRALHQLEQDCKMLVSEINSVLAGDVRNRARNAKARNVALALRFSSLSMFLLLLVYILNFFSAYLPQIPEDSSLRPIAFVTSLLVRGVSLIPSEYVLHFFITSIVSGLLLFWLSKYVWRYTPTLTRKEISRLHEQKNYLETSVINTKQGMRKNEQ